MAGGREGWWTWARRLALVTFGAFPLVSSAAEAAVVLKRGINFEAWQTWTNRQTFLGADYDRSNFPDWTKRLDDKQLAAFRQQGFDFVRLNVDPSPLFWVDEAERATLLDQVIVATRRLQAVGLTVVVDLHLMAEQGDRPDGLHDVLGTDGHEPVLFDRHVALVSDMARRLAPLDPDHTALELINEPDQDWFSHVSLTDRWPAQLAALQAAARAAAPQLTLVLSGARSSSIDGLLRLDPPLFTGDPNIVWTVHYYEPMAITHAGLPWEESPARFLTHLPYPASVVDKAGQKRLLAAADRDIDANIADAGRAKELKAGVRKALADYRAGGAGPDSMAADFARLSDWAHRNTIAPSAILIGEFGVFQDQADPAARLAILADTRKAAEAAGFGWAVYTANLTAPHHAFGLLEEGETMGLEPGVAEALGLAPR